MTQELQVRIPALQWVAEPRRRGWTVIDPEDGKLMTDLTFVNKRSAVAWIVSQYKLQLGGEHD